MSAASLTDPRQTDQRTTASDSSGLTSHPAQSSFLRALAGETLARPPVWFMRQAGRHLPEYRALRATTPDFVSFCLDPEKAAEATLQPMRRFPYDAAIVFADILLVPKALGQEVKFEVGEGPKLGPLPDISAMAHLAANTGRDLAAVGETLSRVRSDLELERALIGFAGAPWTVATYMLQGSGGDRSQAVARAYADPQGVDALLDVLVEATSHYLAMQVQAGAQALQLFESWAEGLAEDMFARLVIGPHRKLVARLRELAVTAPLIGFPRGAGALVEDYATQVAVEGVGLDTQATAALGLRVQGLGKMIQGALDPILLRQGGALLDARVETLMEQWGDGPYVFNLGHGILPDTPIPHVARVLARITGA